jgi:hypothetical protein
MDVFWNDPIRVLVYLIELMSTIWRVIPRNIHTSPTDVLIHLPGTNFLAPPLSRQHKFPLWGGSGDLFWNVTILFSAEAFSILGKIPDFSKVAKMAEKCTCSFKCFNT